MRRAQIRVGYIATYCRHHTHACAYFDGPQFGANDYTLRAILINWRREAWTNRWIVPKIRSLENALVLPTSIVLECTIEL